MFCEYQVHVVNSAFKRFESFYVRVDAGNGIIHFPSVTKGGKFKVQPNQRFISFLQQTNQALNPQGKFLSVCRIDRTGGGVIRLSDKTFHPIPGIKEGEVCPMPTTESHNGRSYPRLLLIEILHKMNLEFITRGMKLN